MCHQGFPFSIQGWRGVTLGDLNSATVANRAFQAELSAPYPLPCSVFDLMTLIPHFGKSTLGIFLYAMVWDEI